jgi:hypothetical protein
MMPDGKQLADISMDDPTAKLFDRGMDHLIHVCLKDHRFGQQYISDWIECMSGYRQVRAMMNSRSKFDFDRVCAFVMTTDSFMERYVALTGREGMTNYFHMLRDGHIAYYLERYNNLYRLSQQGWENVNSIMKRSFHRGTQRGGSRKQSSKIKPVFYRILSAAKWRMGHFSGLLQHFGFKPAAEFKYGDILKIPKFENIPTEDINAYAESVLQFRNSELLNEIEEMVEYDSDNDLEEEMV